MAHGDAVAEALSIVRSQAADITLDWTREPIDEFERSLRAMIIERIERSASSPANRLHAFATLMHPYGSSAMPASDVSEAIRRNVDALRIAQIPEAIERDLKSRRMVQDALRELAGVEPVEPFYNAAEEFQKAMAALSGGVSKMRAIAQDARQAANAPHSDDGPTSSLHRAAEALSRAQELGEHLRARMKRRGVDNGRNDEAA